MGQVLAYGAVIRSGLFVRSSSDQQKLILTSLLSCSKKKSYLPFASSSFIRDLIINVSAILFLYSSHFNLDKVSLLH